MAISIGCFEGFVSALRSRITAGRDLHDLRCLASFVPLARGRIELPTRSRPGLHSYCANMGEHRQLAAVVAIRAFLSFFLKREMAEMCELQRETP
jgi:Protein of unknown function (DUF1622)